MFVTSAIVAGLFGHGTLLSFARRPVSVEWKPSIAPELSREARTDDEARLALNGER